MLVQKLTLAHLIVHSHRVLSSPPMNKEKINFQTFLEEIAFALPPLTQVLRFN